MLSRSGHETGPFVGRVEAGGCDDYHFAWRFGGHGVSLGVEVDFGLAIANAAIFWIWSMFFIRCQDFHIPVLSPGGRRSMTLTLWPLRWASMAKLRPAMPPPATKIDIPVFDSRSIIDVGVFWGGLCCGFLGNLSFHSLDVGFICRQLRLTLKHTRLAAYIETVDMCEASVPDRHRIWEAFLPRRSAVVSLGLWLWRATKLK